MGWSVFEDLLCVAEDGTISVYTLSGDFKRIITMGQVQYMTFLYFNMYLCCNEISFPELIGNLVKSSRVCKLLCKRIYIVIPSCIPENGINFTKSKT
jgi:hypothetical protein